MGLISSYKLFTLKEMQVCHLKGRSHSIAIFVIAFFVLLATDLYGQTNGSKPAAPRTIFRDSDGNLVSNNEFVDIRLANYHYPDKTIMRTLSDGTVEFQLQKIPQEGMVAPNFSVKTLEGKMISMAELKGKVVVLTFWFIGCPVCRAQKPKLNEVRSKFSGRSDVVFLAMTADPVDDVKKYIAKEPFDYLHAVDAKASMEMFVFSGFPKNIVISRNGRIVYWRSPISAWDKFESVILEELVKN